VKHGDGSVMIWAGISWHSAGILNGQIAGCYYVDILGNQGHPVIQMLFPSNGAFFKGDNLFIHTQPEVFNLLLRHVKM
jgi:hypothetical protein